ncbi:hypothetical protein ZEAMMB73_Zm00001d036990 [Zea mays]|uniref:Uncharacterized protein n=1 Tax=Zea mays TaxID=4577 RepID=A0A1D6LT52_MAIZE|nr:hypothetical protein ZEAMMB73_Zm00001d036990 [Zea mays]
MGTSWSSPMPTTLGLFWAPQPTTAPSRCPAHHPPEAQPATQESSVLTMSRVFDDYYIKDCGVISAPKVWHVLSNDETMQIMTYIEVCMILMVAR